MLESTSLTEIGNGTEHTVIKTYIPTTEVCEIQTLAEKTEPPQGLQSNISPHVVVQLSSCDSQIFSGDHHRDQTEQPPALLSLHRTA